MKDVELFWNGLVHEFYHLKALITLEHVITSVVGKKEKTLMSKSSMFRSGVVNCRCMQMSLVMTMPLIFGVIEMTHYVHHISLIFVYLRTRSDQFRSKSSNTI